MTVETRTIRNDKLVRILIPWETRWAANGEWVSLSITLLAWNDPSHAAAGIWNITVTSQYWVDVTM